MELHQRSHSVLIRVSLVGIELQRACNRRETLLDMEEQGGFEIAFLARFCSHWQRQ